MSDERGHAIAKLVADTTLSQTDIQELQQILAEKVTTAPEKVACDCIAPMSCENCEDHPMMV